MKTICCVILSSECNEASCEQEKWAKQRPVSKIELFLGCSGTFIFLPCLSHLRISIGSLRNFRCSRKQEFDEVADSSVRSSLAMCEQLEILFCGYCWGASLAPVRSSDNKTVLLKRNVIKISCCSLLMFAEWMCQLSPSCRMFCSDILCKVIRTRNVPCWESTLQRELICFGNLWTNVRILKETPVTFIERSMLF